jgi:hypothetical protein
MKAQRVKREKGWKKKWILFRNKFSSSFQSGRCWMKVLLFTLFFSSFSGEKLLSIFQLKSVSFAFSRFIHPANCQILQFEYRPMP